MSNGVEASSSSNPNTVTWRANLAYHVTDDWMLFINAGTGFRSGILQSQAQADAVIADGVPSSLALTPDKLRNIEIGTKVILADGALHVAMSAYDIKYSNLQSAFNTSIGLAAFANLGDAETRGVDIDVTWYTPNRRPRFIADWEHQRSEFTNVVPAFVRVIPGTSNGSRLYNTPPYNWRLDLGYERPAGVGGWTVFANGSGSTAGAARNPNAVVSKTDSYSLFNAIFGLRKEQYEVALYGDNLTDERGPTAANGPTLLAGPYPRTGGLETHRPSRLTGYGRARNTARARRHAVMQAPRCGGCMRPFAGVLLLVLLGVAQSTPAQAGAGRVRTIPPRTIPVPETVSVQMQSLLAHAPMTPVAPRSPEEWKALVAAASDVEMKRIAALRQHFSVEVAERAIPGVRCYEVTPKEIPARNRNRLLVTVHGGGYVFGPGKRVSSRPLPWLASVK